MKKIFCALFAFMFCFISCDKDKETEKSPSYSFDETSYKDNLSKWGESGIENYYVKWEICASLPSESLIGELTYKDGKAELTMYYENTLYGEENTRPLPVQGDEKYLDSIEDCFALIKSYAENYKAKFDEGSIVYYASSVKYNETYGYPEFYRDTVYEEWKDESLLGTSSTALDLEILEFKELLDDDAKI